MKSLFKVMQTKKEHNVQIVNRVRWHHWNQGAQNAREMTSLDIVVIDNQCWATSCFTDTYLEQIIDNDSIDKYPLPSGWGKTININNLPYYEKEFIETTK